MRYLVSVQVQNLFASQFESDQPVVVLKEGHVLDANSAAELRGVRVGMGRSEAKSLAYGGRFEEWSAEPFQQQSERWLDICTLFSDLIEPTDQHRAYIDLSGHMDPVDIAETMVHSIEKSTGLKVVWGAGPTKWLAEACVSYGPKPIGDYPVRVIPVNAQVIDRLHALGYRTLDDLRPLGLATLKQQFGEEGLVVFQCCRGGLFEPVEARFPHESISVLTRFESAPETDQYWSVILSRSARRLSRQLVSKDLVASEVEVLLETEKGLVRKTRTFNKSLRDEHGLYAALARLVTRPECPVYGISIRCSNLKKTDNAQQALDQPIPPRSSLERALDSVQRTFGERSVIKGSNVKLSRRLEVLRVWKEATGWW